MLVRNDGVEPKLFKYVVDLMMRAPVYQHLEISIIQMGKGTCELEMLVKQKHCIAEEVIHGGMFMTLGDSAMGLAMQSLGIKGATVEMASQFLHPVSPGQLIVARAQVVKPGKRLIFTKAEIWEQEKLLFCCSGVFVNKGPLNIE